MWQTVALSVLSVMQQGTGSPNSHGHAFAAETAQVAGIELLGQQSQGRIRFKMPGGHALATGSFGNGFW